MYVTKPHILKRLFIQTKVVNMCNEMGIPIIAKTDTVGVMGELYALQHYRIKDQETEYMALHKMDAPYDLRVGNQRIEVKTAVRGRDDYYSIIFAKNQKGGVMKFDKICVVLLYEYHSPPVFAEIEASQLIGLKGIRWKLEKFLM